ncbi:origin recognition complex subunit 1 isoform X2 [Sphaerodactylus townsendi]|uniref:origin recognition complex subunit 1 isoform X2 n=1 Tax=Sphaerodactylus townsendi TaxID=933632 RepID=UPI0020274A2E|nr:origin recognition complex subunit 1 isoform X2 [Sphaerodactylus townsendi]
MAGMRFHSRTSVSCSGVGQDEFSLARNFIFTKRSSAEDCSIRGAGCYCWGMYITSARNASETCIFPGEFILIEDENTGQILVARLQKLFEDDTHQKHAIVQWFSRSVEIPFNQQIALGKEDSQEIFLTENAEWDTAILATSIISNVTVIPLSPIEVFPSVLREADVFFVRESWNGEKFQPLSPSLLAELKDAVKMKSNAIEFTSEYPMTPRRTTCSTEAKNGNVTQSNKEMEAESKHSNAKSSLSKERCSQRMADGINTPVARKKLQLNSPTKFPRSTFKEQDFIELIDSDFIEPLDHSPLKHKVTFTGIKGSPPKISCLTDEKGQFQDIAPLEDTSERSNALVLHSSKRNQDTTLKNRTSAVKNNTRERRDNMNDIWKTSTNSRKQATAFKSNSNQQVPDEEPESDARSKTITPCQRNCTQRTLLSRRKCARRTAVRIAKHLSALDSSGEEDEDNYFPLVKDSDSSSNDDEDKKVCQTPKRKIRPTPKTTRKKSSITPAKTSRKAPEPGTPKIPHNATPKIRSRNQTTQEPANVLEEARIRLHVSAVPESLPCREKEFQGIYNFIESKLVDGTGGCMYISGVPGTGKTATVHEVIRCLQQKVENDELPSFQFIEINGMKLTEPQQAYVQILKLLMDQKATAPHAAVLLEKMFCKPSPKRKTTVLVVDELDLLWTRKQNVMYNLFDWPTQKGSKLIVLAIANTMDLPERIMMNRVASRLGLTRMSFQPYNYKQLQQIVSSRMAQVKAFEEDALQLVSRKVAALSGDARRCLDICRRSTEICELSSQKSSSGLVTMTNIMEAMDEMFSSPYVNAIRNASLQEQIFLKATIAEFHRSGLEEATVQQIFHQHVALCRIEGLKTPTVSEIMAISSRLSACRLLLAESNNKYLHGRIRLNVSQDDVMFAVKQE